MFIKIIQKIKDGDVVFCENMKPEVIKDLCPTADKKIETDTVTEHLFGDYPFVQPIDF